MERRFLVTGASGLVGSGVLAALRARGLNALGSSRTPRGNGWVRLDFEDRKTFDAAFAGIDAVMLIARPGDEQADRIAAPLIDAMRVGGVSKVCLLSALGAERRPEFSLRKVEVLIEASGMAWTHVRPNFFMQMLSTPPLCTEISERGSLSLPLGMARVAYVHTQDVIDLLVEVLVHDAYHGMGLQLSGPQALDHEEVVGQIGRAIGRSVRYVNLGEAQARRLLAERGFGADHIERLMRFYALIRAGWCATADGSVTEVLGRPLKTFGEFASEAAGHWACATERGTPGLSFA